MELVRRGPANCENFRNADTLLLYCRNQKQRWTEHHRVRYLKYAYTAFACKGVVYIQTIPSGTREKEETKEMRRER